ncbi:sensor histidine kinase [Bifidobacterium jacchi]|nr:ATP-binding protein [Bifidobacterium jacchi]
MEWWQIVLMVVVVLLMAAVAAIVGAIAYANGRNEGRELTVRAFHDDESRQSLFGDDVPIREAELGLVRVMPDAVIVCDYAGRVRYASPAANAAGLVEHDRITSDEVRDVLSLTVSDGTTREREVTIPLSVDGRVPSDIVESDGRGVRAGDDVPSMMRYLRVRVGSMCDDLYAIFVNDVSERRRFEAVRRDFVTNVSHELKTPAGAISLLAETIADASDDPKAVRYFAGRVSKESARLTELVHRLIDLQRAQSGDDRHVELKRVPLLPIVRDAIGENAVQAKARDITIRLTLDGRSVPLDAGEGIGGGISGGDGADGATGGDGGDEIAAAAAGDAAAAHVGDVAAAQLGPVADVEPESLKTAVKNLVENAIHYSPEHTMVVVAVASDGGRVLIRVVDQGIGIPAASLGRIFERFYRVDPARSRATGGSGLGLSITRHCVQECGGTISVWSREGEGSTFTIVLPKPKDGNDGDGGDDHAAAAGSAEDGVADAASGDAAHHTAADAASDDASDGSRAD